MQDLADALHSAQPPVLLERKRPTVVKAKVPIIKCTLAAGGHLWLKLQLPNAAAAPCQEATLRLWPLLHTHEAGGAAEHQPNDAQVVASRRTSAWALPMAWARRSTSTVSWRCCRCCGHSSSP